MDLVLAAGDGAVTVDATQRGQLGIRVEAAVARDMFTVTTSSGVVGWDSTRLHEVGARVEARVERVHVRVGQRVGRGDTLFTVSGLEIAATLAELRRASAVEAGDPRGPADRAATEARLAGWGLTPGSGDTATVRSPAAGVVTELGALAGATVANGQILARLADPRAVTAEAWLPEDAAVPSEARVHAPGRSVAAKVLVAEPAVDPATRTRRVVFAAEGLDLPAGAYVSVEIEGAGGAQVAVPVDAVVYTGPRRVVYVAEGDRFVPRTVEVGPRDEGWIAITSGLTVGEQVVTDGVFLIAADSRLRAVTP
jgi:Cu(I)/Ag(I) efflux system membrane fusion protein